MVKGIRYSTSINARRRYNPYIGKRKSIIYHILSKISMNKGISKRKNYVQSSFIDNLETNLFAISEEVENDYSVYKLKKKNGYKKRVRMFSFYNSDGSINCIGILLGMCCDDDYVREKSMNIFFVNIGRIIESEDFRDLITLVFSCGVFICLYFTLFFNLAEFIKHGFNIIM